MLLLSCEEDRPLSLAEAAQARSALAALPDELRAHAFGGAAADGGGGEVELHDLVARCVRGEHPAPRATSVLRDTLLWRRDVGADAVRPLCAAAWLHKAQSCCAADARRAPQLLQQPQPSTAAFHAAWPGSVHGCDAAGHVIWVERFAAMDFGVLAALSAADIVRGRASHMEALQRHKRAHAPTSAAAPRLYLRHVYVLDCGGASASALLSSDVRRVLAAVFAVSDECYTGTLHAVHVVNVHRAARAAWALLRPLLHPETASKVKLHGGTRDFLPAMARDGLHAHALPPALGGAHAGVTLQQLVAQAHASSSTPSTPSASIRGVAKRFGAGGGVAEARRACRGDGCSAALSSFLTQSRAERLAAATRTA